MSVTPSNHAALGAMRLGRAVLEQPAATYSFKCATGGVRFSPQKPNMLSVSIDVR